MQLVESRSISLSIALHVAGVLIAAFGLPALLPPRAEPMPLVMTVELLPVGEITNVKPSEKPIEEEKKAPTPPTPKPVTPSAAAKPKVEPKPVEQDKTFDPMEGAEPEKPKPKDKPKEPKEEPKKDDFAALLNQLKQDAKTDAAKDAKDKTTTEANKTRSDAPYNDAAPLSISEKDTIRSQFLVCWSMPAGAKDAHTLAVRVQVQLQADGTVLAAAIAKDQLGRYNSDTFFRAAADSALRAVHKCSPLKNLPPDKYGSWRDMELNFDPADML
jgi:outer membrane biosynthesis protein TonB